MAIELTQAMHDKRIDQLIGLSAEEVAERRNYIGGSDANTILSGNEERILNLWREKRGEQEPEDLSDVLAVQMGSWTEDLNLYWYEKQTGHKVTARNVQKQHPTHTFIKARADGEIEALNAVIDAKHVGAFNFDMDTIVARYMPQLVVQAHCCRRESAVLSVFSGSNKWEQRHIEIDPLYAAQVIVALEKFWSCVQSGFAPVDLPDASAPVPVELMRKVDMSFSNEWRAYEEDYVATAAQAKTHKLAGDTLKGLVEGDVCEAKGKLIQIKRSKNGSLRISKVK